MLLSMLLLALPAVPSPFDARVDEAQQLRRAGRVDEALALLERVGTDAAQKKDAVSAGRALQKRGDIEFDDRNCEASRQSYAQALTILGKADPLASAQVWNDIGMWAKRCATPTEQLSAFNSALKIYVSVDFTKGIRQVTNNLGSAHFVSGDVAGALPFFKRSASAAKKLGDDEAYLTVQANIALMELLLAQQKFGHTCTEFTKSERASPGVKRALAAFREAEAISLRAGGTALSVCAKFGADYSPLCEPCLVAR